MVIVEPVEGLKYYMDGKLQRELDIIKKSLTKKDLDYPLIIDGPERSGKSVFAQQVAKYVDPDFNIGRVCMTPEQFEEVVKDPKIPKGSAVIFDEAYAGLSSDKYSEKMSKVLLDMMIQMGQKNLFVIIVLPSFFLLRSYVALFRTRGLFHLYTERNFSRGYWNFFNERKKNLLYLNGKKFFNYNVYFGRGKSRVRLKPSFHGRFTNVYALDEEEYRKLKGKAFKTEQEEIDSMDVDKRNISILLYMLHKICEIPYTQVTKFVKMHGISIHDTYFQGIYHKAKEKFVSDDEKVKEFKKELVNYLKSRRHAQVLAPT